MAIAESRKESESKKDGKNLYTWEPPDGGWGYMVALGLVLVFTCTMNTFFAFGLIYGEFLKERGDEITATTYIHGTFGTTFSFMGLLTNQLLTHYSLRLIGIIGSLIYFSGAFLSIFVQNVPQLVFTFGFIQGVGYGLMLPVVFTGFNLYFIKRRALVNCLSQGSMTGLTLLLPVITQFLMERYGQRGTTAIIAAISLHAVFSMVLYHPVEWHMVKHIRDPEIPIPKKECATTYLPENKFQNENPNNVSLIRAVFNILDLSLLNDFKFVNLIIGVALAFVADTCVVNLQPVLLLNRGFSPQTTAFLLTLALTGDFASRILQMILNSFVEIKSRYLVLFGLLTTGISRLVLALSTDLGAAAIAVIAGGFFRSFFHLPLPLAIADSCIQNRFPAAYGLYMIGTGIFNVLLPILLSFMPQDDMVTVSVLAILTLVGGISWIFEMILLKFCRGKSYETNKRHKCVKN